MVNVGDIWKLFFIGLFCIIVTGCSTAIPTDTKFEELEFTSTEGEWTLTTIDINDEFLFRESSNREPSQPISADDIKFSSYREWSFDQESLHMSDFLSNVFDLVSFRENHIYVMATAPTIMPSSDIGWYNTLAGINYSDKYVDYDTSSTDGSIYGATQFALQVQFDLNHNRADFLYIDAKENFDGTITSTLFRRDWAIDREHPYFLGVNRNIWEITSSHHPFVAYTDDYVILIYIDGNEYVLGYIRNENLMFREVLRLDFTADEDGRITGQLPIYAFGNEDGIYFQLITLDNDFLDFDRESTLHFFSFDDDEYTPIRQLGDHIAHINGGDDILVFNYYSIDNPNALTGRIVSLKDKTITTVPNITPANGITQSIIKDDRVFILSRDYIMAYDLQEKTFSSFNINEVSNGDISTIVVSDNEFGWISLYDNSKLMFYRLEYK